MKKKFYVLALLMVSMLFFISCNKETESAKATEEKTMEKKEDMKKEDMKKEEMKDEGKEEAKEETFEIKLSMVFKPSELVTQEIEKVAANIKERSNGSINIDVAHSGQLPVYKDNLEQVVAGANWIAVEDPSYIGDYVPDFAALVGPMLYGDYEEYKAIVKTEYVEGLKAQAEEKGIKILALDYIFGFRNLMTNKEIKTPEDLKGLKIRVPNSQLWVKTLSAMGANPTPIPFTETYAGVQQGVVEGLEGSILTMYATKIYEVVNNMSMTKHFLGTAGVYISPILWDKFSENQQTIILEEFEKGAVENNKKVVELDEEYKTKLEELGIKFNEVDKFFFFFLVW